MSPAPSLRAPTFRTTPVRVRVPATSANLGPGFDCAGLALGLFDTVVVRATGSRLVVRVEGEGAADLPRDRHHLVVKALRTTFDALGGQPHGLEVSCTNAIPQSRGLGSSSAAIVAAVLAARALVVGGDELLPDAAALQLATDLEGHPDNVAPCLYGGLVLSWTGDAGVRALRLDVTDTLAPVAFVPATRSSTKKVRGLLPATVPHADAAANAARAALLTHALCTDPDLLLDATQDWLHQSYRASAMPRTAELVAALRADGIAAVVSGAGPTVLALTTVAARRAVLDRVPGGWTALALDVEPVGAQVTVLA